MHQLLILIPNTIDLQAFDEGWPEFLSAAEKMPGLLQESVLRIDRCLYGQDFLSRIYRFSFPDQETLEQALISPWGEQAGKIIHSLTKGNLILLSGEFNEDSLENLQPPSLS